MSYTSGVFRVDLESGSDTTRTALTSCTASNPAGSTTRINKTAHGLVTGAVVDLTLFSSWLNEAWKITKVDNDNFDLDGAVWQATADTSGTVTPRGGSSWSDAWLTLTSGATTARVQGGDEVRVSKTADPVSLGQNATFTNNSQTVTLTSAVTKKIEDAISGWTAATNITASISASRKLGSTAISLTPAAGFTTGKMAYKAIDGGGTQDFSSYQYISFWFRNVSGVTINANDYKICLCSDATGDVIVNEINIPAITSSTAFCPLSLNYGGNLSATVQSVAIYANVDPSTNVISINNIFASTGISLVTPIGPSGDVNYNIQSIDGTTIKIDSNNTSATGRGWSGSTTTETIYYLVPKVYTTNSYSSTLSIGIGGTAVLGRIHVAWGYNTSNDTRDGYTCITPMQLGQGSGNTILNTQNYLKISYLKLFRGNISVGQSPQGIIDNCIFAGGTFPIQAVSNYPMKISNCKFLNWSGGVSVYGSRVTYENCEFRNTETQGVQGGLNASFLNCTFANNPVDMSLGEGDSYGRGAMLARNCTFSSTTEFTASSNRSVMLYSFDHDNSTGSYYAIRNSTNYMMWQTGTKQGADPGAWKIVMGSTNNGVGYPLRFKICEVACVASSLVTVKAWIKKDHATDVAAKLYVQDAAYNIAGVVASSATKASDTNWEELTITFTPTQAGVVPILVDAWYVAGASNVYIGSLTITQ